MFTPAEKKAIIFLCAILLIACLMKASDTKIHYPEKFSPADSITVSLNNAPAKTLEKVPYIGPKTANKIIDYRKQNQGFKSLPEIKSIKGIGDKKFKAIKKYFVL
jgi:competence protein ComEA